MIRERIARGGMGEVFRAVAVGVDGFEKPVVIKRLLPKFAGRSDLARLFAAEAKLMTRLVHPNIVQVIDFGRGENDDYFLVMELVHGVDLGRLAQWHSKRNSRIPLPIVLFIISQVLRGLAHAHGTFSTDGQRLVHRDISPGNVLVSTFGEVKVADFGVALVAVRADANATTPGLVVGKPGYIAPEQFGCSAVDERADLYSLGALFFEVLTGELPIIEGSASPVPGSSSAAYARSVATGGEASVHDRRCESDPPAPDPGACALGTSVVQQLSAESMRALRGVVPAAIADIVTCALAASPEDRYPDARTMGHAVANLATSGIAIAGADDLAELVTKVTADEQAAAVPVVLLGAGGAGDGELGGTELTRSHGAGIGHFTVQVHTESSVHPTGTGRPRTVRVAPVDTPDALSTEGADPESSDHDDLHASGSDPGTPPRSTRKRSAERQPAIGAAAITDRRSGTKPTSGGERDRGATFSSIDRDEHVDTIAIGDRVNDAATESSAHNEGTSRQSGSEPDNDNDTGNPRNKCDSPLAEASSATALLADCADASSHASPAAAISDASTDASSAAISDASTDASSVAISDASADASSVAISDASADASSVAISDASADASSAAISDASADASHAVIGELSNVVLACGTHAAMATATATAAATGGEKVADPAHADRADVMAPGCASGPPSARAVHIENHTHRSAGRPDAEAPTLRWRPFALLGAAAAIVMVVGSMLVWRLIMSVEGPGARLDATTVTTAVTTANHPLGLGTGTSMTTTSSELVALGATAAPTDSSSTVGLVGRPSAPKDQVAVAPPDDRSPRSQTPLTAGSAIERSPKGALPKRSASTQRPGRSLNTSTAASDGTNRETSVAAAGELLETAPGNCRGQLHVYASNGWILEGGPGTVQAPGRYEWPCGRYTLSATSRLDASRIRHFSISVQSGATSVLDLR